MNPRIDQLVKTLLQKKSLADCSLAEVREYADRYPYFGAAQLLLAKKLQVESPEQYDEQLQKTFSFFHNPVWVEHLLNENGHATISPASKGEEVLKPASGPAKDIQSAVTGDPAITEEAPAPSASIPKEEEQKPVDQLQSLVTAAAMEEEREVTVEKIKIPEKQEILFEPFHTVDYFASQGIRLKEEEKPVDRFGQQLRSFTEWLKTMKRLPASQLAELGGPVAERKVEELAAGSLEGKEVYTEAMAEVWEKQGNLNKALEIYEKLSLYEPVKSAYFAAKIEAIRKRI